MSSRKVIWRKRMISKNEVPGLVAFCFGMGFLFGLAASVAWCP